MQEEDGRKGDKRTGEEVRGIKGREGKQWGGYPHPNENPHYDPDINLLMATVKP